jgi:hypothetical protein
VDEAGVHREKVQRRENAEVEQTQILYVLSGDGSCFNWYAELEEAGLVVIGGATHMHTRRPPYNRAKGRYHTGLK